MSHESGKTPIKSFTDLDAWKYAHDLALLVYKATKQFPDDEKFGLVNQIRRAAVSMPSNIAEGFGRSTPADRARFYDISLGSTREVQAQLLLSKDLGYLPESDFSELAELSTKVQQIIAGLIRASRSKST